MGCFHGGQDWSLGLRCVFPFHRDTSFSSRWNGNLSTLMLCREGLNCSSWLVQNRRAVGLSSPLLRPRVYLPVGVLLATPLLREDPYKHRQVLQRAGLWRGKHKHPVWCSLTCPLPARDSRLALWGQITPCFGLESLRVSQPIWLRTFILSLKSRVTLSGSCNSSALPHGCPTKHKDRRLLGGSTERQTM